MWDFIIPPSTTTQGYLNLKSYAEFAKAGSALVRAQDFRFAPKTRHLRINEYTP
jgi:hypothetical protein